MPHILLRIEAVQVIEMQVKQAIVTAEHINLLIVDDCLEDQES